MNRIFIGILVGGLGGGIIGAYVAGHEQGTNIVLTPSSSLNRRAAQGLKIVKNTRSKEGFNSDLLTKSPRSSQDLDMLDDYCAGWTAEQLIEAIRKIKTLPLENNAPLIEILLFKLAEIDPRMALDEARRLKFRIYGIFDLWASKNPKEAAAYYVENRKQLRIDEVNGIAKQWGELNMEEAWTWASTLTSGERVKAREALLEILMKTDLALAVEKFTSLPGKDQIKEIDRDSSNSLYSKIAAEWVIKDREAVKTWIKTLPQEKQDEVFRVVIKEFSAKEPEQAMTWMLENLNKEDNQSLFTVGKVMENWQIKDSEAVKQWIREQPEGNWKNNLVEQYAFRGNPSRIFSQEIAFIEEMRLPKETHQEVLSNLLSDWMQQNNKEATEWVNSSSLSEEEKKAILEEHI